MKIVWPQSITIPATPTTRQRIGLACSWRRELLFGGAAGGGKSYFLLMAALQYVDWPEYRALITRRTFPQLKIAEGLLETAADWLSGQATGSDTVDGLPTRWRFPSGATLDFGHMQHLKDRTQYQGGAWHFYGLDELTQFLEGQYLYVAFSRQRRTVQSKIPMRVRATSNPGGEGHEWVRQRFLEEGETIHDGPSLVSPLRGFLPSKIRDNPYLDADAYEESLSELHPYERAMLMEGDWDVRPPGSLFQREWFPVFDEIPGAVVRQVRYWDLAATASKEGTDPDWSVGTLLCKLADGSPVDYVIADVVRFRAEPGPTERKIRAVAEADGHDSPIRIEKEPGSSGKIAANALSRTLDGFSVSFDRPTGDKVNRSGPLASAAEAGRVGVLRRDWLTDWIRELEMFPGGSHDDQVDSASGAYATLAVSGGVTWDDLYSSSGESASP